VAVSSSVLIVFTFHPRTSVEKRTHFWIPRPRRLFFPDEPNLNAMAARLVYTGPWPSPFPDQAHWDATFKARRERGKRVVRLKKKTVIPVGRREKWKSL
jgi:hypothetical protein